jgi:hypothetical protein
MERQLAKQKRIDEFERQSTRDDSASTRFGGKLNKKNHYFFF